MAGTITNEQKKQINELYCKLGTYAGVARELGIAPTTVKKYIVPDYIPDDKLKFTHCDLPLCKKIVEEFEMPSSYLSDPNLLVLSDEELEGVKQLWEEMQL